jgi:deoxycytidine triphosphate deaminase
MVVYDLVEPPARDYSQTGRYQNQTGATPAREAR